MHIDVFGSGPALILIHGWAMHGGVFAPLVRELAPSFSCYVVDLPGHGLSAAEEGLSLDRTVERLLALLPPAYWLGWSLGGLFALEAAARAPQRVHGLIEIAASPRFVKAADWPFAVEALLFEQFGADLARDYPATIERFLALEVLGEARAREEIRWLRQRLAERAPCDPNILIDGLALLAHTDLRDELPRLAMPSLWIAGARDRLVPSSALQFAANAAPAGQFLRLERAAHAPFLSHTQAVATAIGIFVSAA